MTISSWALIAYCITSCSLVASCVGVMVYWHMQKKIDNIVSVMNGHTLTPIQKMAQEAQGYKLNKGPRHFGSGPMD